MWLKNYKFFMLLNLVHQCNRRNQFMNLINTFGISIEMLDEHRIVKWNWVFFYFYNEPLWEILYENKKISYSFFFRNLAIILPTFLVKIYSAWCYSDKSIREAIGVTKLRKLPTCVKTNKLIKIQKVGVALKMQNNTKKSPLP